MILLTGAKGFIGRNFLEQYDSSDVIAIDREDCWDFLAKYTDWKNISLIVHQGAISSTTEKNIDLLYRTNVMFSIRLFEKAIQYGVPVKYASSASVYGNNTKGEVNPLNLYAISKLQVDYFVQDNIERFSHIQGFRYFNVYGRHEENKGDQASPITKFTQQAKETGHIRLFEGSENFYRDFVCVDDLINIVLFNEKPSGIYDLGTSKPVSFKHVAELVAERHGVEIDIIPFPKHLEGKYQDYTCAKEEWLNHNFTTVKDYMDDNSVG